MSLFSELYFYAFLVASAFSFVLQRAIQSFNGSSSLAMTLITFVGAAAAILNPIFLVLGFWFMESWWHPIVCLVLGFVASLVAETVFTFLLMLLNPIANVVALFLVKVVTVIAIVVMYLSLFNVI